MTNNFKYIAWAWATLMTLGCAAIKAQVRKEIEKRCVSTYDNTNQGMGLFITKEDLDDCLSIPSLKGEE